MEMIVHIRPSSTDCGLKRILNRLHYYLMLNCVTFYTFIPLLKLNLAEAYSFICVIYIFIAKC